MTGILPLFRNVDISGNQIPFSGITIGEDPREIQMKPEAGVENSKGMFLLPGATQCLGAGLQQTARLSFHVYFF